MSMQRKKIVWNSNEDRVAKRLRLMPHIPNREAPKEFSKEYCDNLQPGALWYTTSSLTKDFTYPENAFDHPPFPYLIHGGGWGYSTSLTIPINTLALYIGEIRVNEVTQLGREVSVIRHCFLINGCRYLTRDINDFMPVSSQGVGNVI